MPPDLFDLDAICSKYLYSRHLQNFIRYKLRLGVGNLGATVLHQSFFGFLGVAVRATLWCR